MNINHYTLSTGNNRVIKQGEVKPSVIEEVSKMIDGALEAAAPAPTVISPKFQFTATPMDGGCLKVEIIETTHNYPVCVFMIAPENGDAESEMLSMLGKIDMIGVVPDVLPAPYCAVALTHFAPMHMFQMTWLGDFERCFAIAWVGRQKNKQ